MGIGIWSMHFVGMLALHLPVDIGYDVWLTLLSMLIAVVVSTFALRIASREQVSGRALIGAGIAMGIGICAMHYVGMSAIEIDPPIVYDPTWVAVSFAVAIAASFGALGVVFSAPGPAWWRNHRVALGAIGMGLAIAGMHYAGMVAAQFPANATSSEALVSKGWLAGSVTMISLFVLLSALLLSLVEARAAARAAQFQASLAQATQSSREKDEFLAMLGHELRNPLAAISNAAELLKRAEADSPHRKLAQDMIARQTLHLTRIVDDLLDVGRAISGKMVLQREPLELKATIAAALRGLAAAERTADRRVAARGRDGLDRCGSHAHRTGGEQPRVQRRAAHGLGRAHHDRRDPDAGLREITVRDDGAGMDAETAARAFDLFFQAKQGPERQRGGLGIGLTLVRRIVELHGGTITVESAGPGLGTAFTLAPARRRRPASVAPSKSQSATASARRVVLVEDSDDARISLQRILEHEGHTVHTAADGPAGLEAIARLKPDVALIDIGLPGIDGYTVARQLRARGLRTCLVALTGYGLAQDRRRAMEAGFDVHLTKPPAMERLLALVASA